MQKWLRINGTDFNVEVCSLLSLDEFKEEGKTSFAEGKTIGELKETHYLIQAAGSIKIPHNLSETQVKNIKTSSDGNISGSEKASSTDSGKRKSTGD